MMTIQTELILSKAALTRKAGGGFLSVRAQFARLTIRENYRKERTNLILGTAPSIKGVPIRLTEERWEHILDHHAEFSYGDYSLVLEAIESAEYILLGRGASLIAVVALGRAAYLHVFYRELGRRDGFIITAAIRRAIDKAKVIWRQ